LAKILKNYVAEKKKINKAFTLNSTAYFTKMTLQQMDETKEAVPDLENDRNYISNYFQKAFEVSKIYT
jgi:N-acetylglutamate synthase-like GNAT family acetyltransferase